MEKFFIQINSRVMCIKLLLWDKLVVSREILQLYNKILKSLVHMM